MSTLHNALASVKDLITNETGVSSPVGFYGDGLDIPLPPFKPNGILNFYPAEPSPSGDLLPRNYRHISYQEKISLGQELRGKEDAIKFALGDLASSILSPDETELSTNLTLTAFAHEINANPDTLRHYTKMARFWPDEYRADYWPNLSFSHLKEAMYFAQDDLAEAVRVCDHASVKGLTVGGFKDYLKEQKETRKDAYHQEVIRLKDLLGRSYEVMEVLMQRGVLADSEIMDEIREALKD